VAVLVALIVPLVIMWPVPLRPHRAFFGYPGDAIATLRTFSHPFVGTGTGIRAFLPRQRWLVDAVGGLVGVVTNAFIAYNAVVFLSFPLSLAAAYLLCRRLGVPPWASLLGGVIFAYSPYHLHRCYAHLYLATTQGIPLFLVASMALARRFDARRLVGLVGAVALLFLTSAYYGVFACAFLPLIVVWRLVWRHHVRDARRWWRDPVLLGLLVVLLVVFGVLWRMYGFFVRVAEVGGSDWLKFAHTFSARWWNYLVPASDHPIVGGLLRDFWAERLQGSNVGEQALYVGYGVLFLAVAGVVSSLREGPQPERRWMLLLMVAVLALLLSGAPHLQLGGVRIPTLSWLLWRVVPVLRAHTRMAGFLMAALAPFAALGAARLVRRPAGTFLVILAVALIVAEYNPIPPFRCTTLEPPPAIYGRLGAFQEGEKMVEYPAQNLREGSPVASVVSYLRSLPERPPALLAPDADPSRYAVVGPRIAGIFGAHGVRWLAAMGYNTLYPPDRFPKDWARAAEASFGWSPLIMSHSRLRLSTSYDTDRLYEPLSSPPPVSYGAAAGFVPAPVPRTPWSWSADGGRVWVHNHGPEPLSATVVFHLTSYGGERTVTAYAEKGQIAELLVPVGEEVSLHLPSQRLRVGPNDYYLRCEPPASDPSRPLVGGDTRALGVCVRSVEVRSGDEPLTDVTFEQGFFGLEAPPEGLLEWWMGTRGAVHIRNWSGDSLTVSVHMKLRSRGRDRTLDLSLNGEALLRPAVSMSYIRTLNLGGVRLAPGLNMLTFDELTEDPPDLDTPRMGMFDFWVMAPGEPAFRVSYERGFRRGATGEFPEGPKICDGTGALYLINAHDAIVKVELQLRLRSLGAPAQVAVSLNGYRIGSLHLSESGVNETRFQDLSLVRGDNLLLLTSIAENRDVPLSVEQVSIRRLEGFYPPEATPQGISRWMAHHAAYIVGNQSGAPWRGALRVVAKSFAMPRTLEIYRGQTLLRAVRIPSATHTPVTIPGVVVEPGENTFTFYSPDGADPVSAYTETNDQRPVSFRFFGVSLEPQQPRP
jgi:hypothetical protein